MSRLSLSTQDSLILNIDQLWISTLTVSHWQKKKKEALFWLNLKAALIYGYKQTFRNQFNTRFIWQNNNSNILTGILTGAYDFHSQKFWPGLQCQEWIPSCEVGLHYKRKAVGYSRNSHAIIVPEGTSCLEGVYYTIWGTQLGKAIWWLHHHQATQYPTTLQKLASRGACNVSQSWFLYILQSLCFHVMCTHVILYISMKSRNHMRENMYLSKTSHSYLLGCPLSHKPHNFILHYGWKNFLHLYTPYCPYPFLCWWTPKSLPLLGYCVNCFNRHWCVNIFVVF